jgi:hypothetical protein
MLFQENTPHICRDRIAALFKRTINARDIPLLQRKTVLAPAGERRAPQSRLL